MTSSTQLSLKEKKAKIIEEFSAFTEQESIYKHLMQWGKQLIHFPQEDKIESHLVQGCQSTMYLASSFNGEIVSFRAFSDALISSGLAAILLYVYNQETPEIIIKNPPLFIQECGINSSLTPGRSNGFASLYRKMQQEALKYLIQKHRSSL